MRTNLLLTKALVAVVLLLGGVSSVWATPTLVFSEDFSGGTYNVTWGGTSAGGIAPDVSDGVLSVSNGSQSGDRSAYVSFGDNAVAGSAHLKFDMGITKSGWSGKNNTFYLFPTNTNARYPEAANSAMTINQDSNGYITINGENLDNSTAYNGTVLTYDVYLNSATNTVKVIVSNGTTEIKTFNYSTTSTGIGAMHLTFNKNYGAFAIDNISLYSLTAPDFTLADNAKTVNVNGSETVSISDITGAISVKSSNTAAATVSYDNGTVTINGIASGVATITVTGENDGLTLEKTIEVTVGEVATTTVTVNYLCDNVAIANPLLLEEVSVGSTLTESAIVYDAIIYGTGCRYVNPVLSSELPYTVEENGVINISYTQQAAVSSLNVYTNVNGENNLFKTIELEDKYVGDQISFGYPQYICWQGSLYEANKNSSGVFYRKDYTLTQNNDEVIISYNQTQTTGVVFYAEAENVNGMTANDGNNANIRCSGAYGAYAESDVTLTTLSPGKYKIYAQVWGNSGATFTMTANGTEVWSKGTVGYLDNALSEEFSLTESTDIIIPAAGSNGKVIDLIYIVQTAAFATIGANGFTTFASACPLDLANLPEGLNAYTATLDGVTLSFQKCEQAVPAGTGLLLEGTPGETYTIPVTATFSEVENNALTGVTTVTPLKSDDTKYIFAMKKATSADDPLSFAPLTSESEVNFPAGKAYIKVEASAFESTARALVLTFDDATSVKELKNSRIEELKSYYNLNGQRVSQPSKGLYIVNGKKVVIK